MSVCDKLMVPPQAAEALAEEELGGHHAMNVKTRPKSQVTF